MKPDYIPFVSIIMPVRNEAVYIERSLESVLAQDYPIRQLEILIVDGCSTDGTKEKIADIQKRFPNRQIKVVDNPGQYMPIGFNLGLRHALGKIIIMLGGHAEIAPNYVLECVQLLIAEQQVVGVGGAMVTVSDVPISQSIAVAMGMPFGVGNVAFRINSDRIMEVDTVVYAAYRRNAFEESGCLDEEMIRNQDDEFNYRLREHGGKILFSPTIRSQYYSRSSFSSLWRQYFQYGFWKVRILQKHPLQMRPRQFVPPVFVLALFVSVLLPLFGDFHLLSPVFRFLFLIIPSLYLFANLSASIYTASKHGWRHLSMLPLVFIILHISYGLGFLVGLFKFWNRWGDKIGKTPVWSSETNG